MFQVSLKIKGIFKFLFSISTDHGWDPKLPQIYVSGYGWVRTFFFWWGWFDLQIQIVSKFFQKKPDREKANDKHDE